METSLGKDMLEQYWNYCKEERQFAVFLYNTLREKMGKPINTSDEYIVRECLNLKQNIELTIEDVYFEATLMRDYFAKEDSADKSKEHKICFNDMLLEFCLGWMNGDDSQYDHVNSIKMKLCNDNNKDFLTRNLGQKKAKDVLNEVYSKDIKKLMDTIENIGKGIDIGETTWEEVKEKACLDIACMMMSATPDLLVKYSVTGSDNTTYVKALECKNKSGEGRYKDVAGVNCKMQLFIQECIMHFCFGKRNKLDYEDNPKGINELIPKYPEGSMVWRSKIKAKQNEGTKLEERENIENINKMKRKLWTDICENVYLNILGQEDSQEQRNSQEQKGKLINAGVELIKFYPTCNSEKAMEINNKVYIQVRRIDKRG